jgi:predicted transcriptional regulator
MSDIKITVGGALEADATRRFTEAWQRAARGELFAERHLAFENWDTLTRILTAKRLDILRHVHHHTTTSIRALAKTLGRDYSNVHADVHALMSAGLLEVTSAGVRVDYDSIETKIAI